jgi:hypothetical protein
MNYQYGQGSERVIREAAPRRLSLYSKSTILFGGVIQQLGWVLLFFGLIFSVAFIPNSEISYIFTFDGEWVQTKAIIKEISQTSARENKIYLYAYTYDFSSKDGKLYKGTSYDYLNENYKTGKTVDVQYKSKNPNHSRIVGMRRAPFNSIVALVLLFPLVGIVMLVIGLLKGFKALNLVINGKFTKGRKISAEPTGVQINRRPEYKFVFSFEVSGRTYEAICKTHETRKVEDEEKEIILYNEQHPEDAIVYDSVTNVPKINNQGNLEPASMRQLPTLLFPSITFLTLILILIYFFT